MPPCKHRTLCSSTLNEYRRQTAFRRSIEMTMLALADRRSVSEDVVRKLSITITTLHEDVNSEGSPKDLGRRILCTATAPVTEF
jgi:hypothetical protein